MPTSLRFATPDDAPAVHRMICELAAYEREPDVVEVTPNELAAQLRSEPPPFQCVVAENEAGELLGIALFFHNYSTWRGRPGIYLEDLFVPERHRGRGVGAALLGALARLAHERGCARLEWSVLDWNADAIAFYQRLGAKPMRGWTTYRLTDDPLRKLAAQGPAVRAVE